MDKLPRVFKTNQVTILMSYENQSWTEHLAHVEQAKFVKNCEYCDTAKDFGKYVNGKFVTKPELRARKEDL